MKRSVLVLAAFAALLITLVAVPIFAGHVSPVAVFESNPEGLAVDEDGNLYVGLLFTGQIKKVSPDGSEVTNFATLPSPGSGFMVGMAFDNEGDLFVAMASLDVNHGVWRIDEDGNTELFASLPTDGTLTGGLPNVLTFDEQGDLFVSDSTLGLIWRISPDGVVESWVEHPLLVGDPDLCPPVDVPFAVGANGVVFDSHGDLLVANTDFGSIIRVPVKHNGKAGTPTVVAGPSCDILEGADGIEVDDSDNIFVVVNRKSTLVRVNTDGSIDTLATAADNSLDFPASVHFGKDVHKNDLFFTNLAFGSGDPANFTLLKISLGDDDGSSDGDSDSDSDD